MRDWQSLWRDQRAMVIGTVAGVLFAIFVLWFGLWATVFILVMGCVGAVVGHKHHAFRPIWEWLRQRYGPQ